MEPAVCVWAVFVPSPRSEAGGVWKRTLGARSWPTFPPVSPKSAPKSSASPKPVCCGRPAQLSQTLPILQEAQDEDEWKCADLSVFLILSLKKPEEDHQPRPAPPRSRQYRPQPSHPQRLRYAARCGPPYGHGTGRACGGSCGPAARRSN